MRETEMESEHGNGRGESTEREREQGNGGGESTERKFMEL